ncbi:uncharacterized protein, partial [Miscanthus floridulus]|uniref:uncharacterized protein n=1 Tax=Miscanthus floridulus TaxID=154761 RepID=UPI00345AA960
MAATADPRAKPPAAAPHHLAEPWAHQAASPAAAHRSMPVVASAAAAGGGGCGARDRRRSSSSHRRSQAVGDDKSYDGGIEALRAKLMGHLRDAADRLRVPQPSRSTAASLPPAPRPPPPKAAAA